MIKRAGKAFITLDKYFIQSLDQSLIYGATIPRETSYAPTVSIM